MALERTRQPGTTNPSGSPPKNAATGPDAGSENENEALVCAACSAPVFKGANGAYFHKLPGYESWLSTIARDVRPAKKGRIENVKIAGGSQSPQPGTRTVRASPIQGRRPL